MRADIHQFSSAFFPNNTDRFSVEDIWQQTKQTILKAVADNVPSKLVGAKSKRTYPWLTAQVCRYIRCRDRLAAIAKKSGLEIDRQRFRKARNEVNSLINQSYQGYLNTVIGHLSKDSRAFYCFIKKIKELNQCVFHCKQTRDHWTLILIKQMC